MIGFAVFIRLVSLYLTPGSSAALWPAFFELHLGTYHLSQTTITSALLIPLLAAVLGWSGLCSHLQVSAVLKTTSPNSKSMLYFAGVRLIHGLIAFSSVCSYGCRSTVIAQKPGPHFSPMQRRTSRHHSVGYGYIVQVTHTRSTPFGASSLLHAWVLRYFLQS